MNRPTVAVTGATGRIGAPLVDALLRAGRVVRALSRHPQPPRSGLQWMVGDLLDAGAVAALVDGVDTVFHAGGELRGEPDVIERSLVQGTENVLRAAKAARIVHLSSLVVLDTGSAASPHVIDENCTLEPHPERRGIYTRAKSAAEAMVRSATDSQDAVIVRPGLVMSGDDGTIPMSIGLRMGRLVCFVGAADGALPVVHAEDVATGLLLAATGLKRGEVLHLVDPMRVTRTALLRRITAGHRTTFAFPAGRAALTVAARVASSGGPAGNMAYRVLSAGKAHEWSAERASALHWRPSALAAWFAAAAA